MVLGTINTQWVTNFSKDFEKKEWAEKYLAVVKKNANKPFYYKIKENGNKFTLKLYKAEYWEE